MVITQGDILDWLGRFVWPLTRTSGLVLSAPVLGSRYVPGRVRIAVALLLALVLAAMLPHLPPLPTNPWRVIVMAGANVFYGAVLGFVMWLTITAIAMGGEMIGLSMALGFARMASPATGTPVPILSIILSWVGLMAYLAVGGPVWLIAALQHSFITNPAAHITLGNWQAIALAGADMFRIGLWLALPVIATALAVNAVLGVITSLAPSLNVFSIGFPLLYLMGMWLLLASSGDIQTLFSHMYKQVMMITAHLVVAGGGSG